MSDRGDETLSSRLIDEERSRTRVLAESWVLKENIHSLCASGPLVAGYASKDSDYEMIIVTKNSNKNVPEKPVDVSVRPSPLIIDLESLLNAATRPSPGELLIGRFLNIYEPLVNSEFLHRVEVEYKKRVIAEALIEIQADYRDFSSNLILPYEYFLFDRLHKRALEYPDETESYGRTYGGVHKEENLEFTLRGFREAAEFLASRGIVRINDDSVRILKGRMERKNVLSMLYEMYPRTAENASHYALHSIASGAGVKLKAKPLPEQTIMEKVEGTVDLDRPRRLLRLEEGVVFDDASRTIEELARMSGFGEIYEFQVEKMGDLINSSKLLEIWGNGRRSKYILKRFPELKSVKWVLLNLWSIAAKRFNMSPLSRLNREVEAVRRLHGLGIKTHHITGIILDERTLVTEYYEGVTLDKSVREITTGMSTDMSDIQEYAQALGKLHKAGLVYGDTKPHNAFVGEDGIYLLDLEQSMERGDKAWDLAEFLYYSAKIAKQEEGMRLVAESFLEAYRIENGGQVIRKARHIRYLTPFMLFLAPKMRKVVRESLAKYSQTEVSI
jgi:tRNA A-37 threonylcarbamoyl transferase component Bud32